MTHEAFLRAITDAPHDDAPRLVYADWLDEYAGTDGAARAEFIRAQVEHEQLPAGDVRRDELHRRSLELLDEHGPAWLALLPKLEGVAWHGFWRGFVGGAVVQAWKFYRRHADALFTAAPVQFLTIFGVSASTCGQLAASPHLARLVGIHLMVATIGNEGAAALAASPWVGNLRQLCVRGLSSSLMGGGFRQGPWQIGNVGAKALASSPNLGRLELLDLRGSAVGPEAAESLRQRFGRAVLL
jgi:uncharacterized protein (TIGR02996 family)